MDDDVQAAVTRRMALYVHDCLPCPPDDDGQRVFRGLVLKCLGLWRGEEDEGTIRLNGPELWLLQPIAKSMAALGPEKIGMAWLQIVADGLLHLEAQAEVHEAVARQGDGVVEEPRGRDEADVQMRAWIARQAPGGSDS